MVNLPISKSLAAAFRRVLGTAEAPPFFDTQNQIAAVAEVNNPLAPPADIVSGFWANSLTGNGTLAAAIPGKRVVISYCHIHIRNVATDNGSLAVIQGIYLGLTFTAMGAGLIPLVAGAVSIASHMKIPMDVNTPVTASFTGGSTVIEIDAAGYYIDA